MRGRVVRATSIVLVSLAPLVAGEEPVDHEIINLIRYEGFHNSQVLEIARALTEEIGPRLTGSPQLKQANEWTRDKLASWGLDGAHLESLSRMVVHEGERPYGPPGQAPASGAPQSLDTGNDRRGVRRGDARQDRARSRK